MNLIQQIKKTNKTFVIAEIGQNHQGNMIIAKQLIKIAKDCGADCVKFQKTCLEEKFTKSTLDLPYKNSNSWGKTYGEHKKYLEFSEEEFLELQAYAKEVNILFTASCMDLKSLDFLQSINPPFIKIGSGDSNNPFLIEAAAKTGVPLIISTGMINFEKTKRIYQLVSNYHKNFALLHCISAYPTPSKNINLNVIRTFKKEFPDILIGYSGHENSNYHVSVCAVATGAKIIERHLTLNKNQKGTDHQSSLIPIEFKQLVALIRLTDCVLGQSEKVFQPCEKLCWDKLGKSLVYAMDFNEGHIIEKNDLKIKVATPKGIDGFDYENVLGKKLNCNVKKDESVQTEHLS